MNDDQPTQSDAAFTAWLRSLEPGRVQLDRLPKTPVEVRMLQHTQAAA